MSSDTSTTQSNQTGPQPENPTLSPEQATQKILEKKAGLNLAMMGTALQSMRRGLGWEHNMVEQDSTQNEKGGELGPSPTEKDDMGPLVVGDVSFNESTQTPDSSKQTEALVELTKLALQAGQTAAPIAQVAATGISPWWIAIPTALTLLSGGYTAYQSLKDQPQPITQQVAEPQETTTIINKDGNEYSMEFAEPQTKL